MLNHTVATAGFIETLDLYTSRKVELLHKPAEGTRMQL